jgi:hypothetical protein
VDLTKNFYWSIDDESLFATAEKPKELDVGSLVDDWEFVLSASKHPDRALPANLVHVAPLLRALAMAVPSYTKPKDK